MGPRELTDAFVRRQVPLLLYIRRMESLRDEYTGPGHTRPELGRAVVSARDRHTEGRDLIAILLEMNGFEVVRVGPDTSLEDTVTLCADPDVTVLCVSVQSTARCTELRKVPGMLEGLGVREKIIFNAGGGPVSEAIAQECGCDVYSHEAVESVRKILEERERRLKASGRC